MDDLDRYITKRKKKSAKFAKEFDAGYQEFKIGAVLKHARQEAGITQADLAKKLYTQKSAISRMENHAEDIRISTLKKFAEALGKSLRIEVA
jgi:HTH-type transcriptional regulator / antitoxin HipB